MSKQTIDIGAAPNDGQGDPLRVAMEKCNDNFDEIYTAGPVSSNIRITNNSIISTVANSDITITANGAGRVNLGDPANITISGGSSGYVLTTDGTGNLSWQEDEPGPNLANISVNVLPSANITYNLGQSTLRWASVFAGTANISGNASFGNIVGPVSVIGNITAGNTIVTGNVQFPDGTRQATAYPGTQFSLNLLGNIIAGNVTSRNELIANNFTANIGISSVNITASSNIAAANANFTSLTANSSSITGNITVGNVIANYLYGDGSSISNVAAGPGGSNTQIQFNNSGLLAGSSNFTWDGSTVSITGAANISSGISAASAVISGNTSVGNLSATGIAGTLSTAAQPNITSVGTLSSLTVSGNIAGGNVNAGSRLSFTDGSSQTTAYPGTQFSLSLLGNVLAGNVVARNHVIANTITANISITSSGNITGNILTINDSANISNIAYTMGNATHWTSNVFTVGAALDQLAARIYAIENP